MRKHPLAQCESCPLYEDGAFVPTQNPRPIIPLAVVGEGPGAYEAERGIPFTGPSGKLLDQVLSHHGYNRSYIMVTNTVLCRSVDSDGQNIDPPKAAIAACKPRLTAELATAEVNKILACGGTAATNLVETKRTITTIRVGPPRPYKENPSIEVVSTWHPAFCLRSPDAFPSFVSDTAKLNGWNYEPWPTPKYWVFDDGLSIRSAIRRLSTTQGPLIIDIETGIDKDTTVVHPENYDLLCVGIAFAKSRAVIFPGPELIRYAREDFADLLRHKRLVAHNGKFDLGGLFPHFGELELYADTMLMSRSLDERPGNHSLEKLGMEKLNTPDWKSVIEKHIPRGGNYANIPKDVLYKYNAYDVGATWDLYHLFLELMDERAKQEHAFMIAGSNALMHLERAGIHFDEEYNEKLTKEFSEELFNLELELTEIAGRQINPRSWQQVTKYLEDNHIMVTSTEADVLEAILPMLEGNPKEFVSKLLVHRKRSKLFGTYIKGMTKRVHDGKIFTTYSLHATTSGRLASRNPNLQNIVRDKRIKKQFVVGSKDNVLVQIDYKQAEGRVITTLAKDEYLASLFNNPDRDIFDELTDQIYGPGHICNDTRVRIKSVFYGLAYGRGPMAIAIELGIPEKEARDLVRNFKALIPATISWQASISHKVLSGQDLVTPFGRKRSFYLITDQNRTDVLNEALSFLPQSIASDICLSALISVVPKLKDIATMRLTVHDALYAECNVYDKELVAEIISHEMVASGLRFTDYVPFEVDVKFGKSLGEL